jgi:hypothetical protein
MLGTLMLGAASASAQTPAPGSWAAIVSVNFGTQLGMTTLEQASELAKYVEPATLAANAPAPPGPLLDGGVTVRVWRNLGVTAAVSLVGTDGPAEIVAEIPHPFYFDRPRTVEGEVALWRQEAAVHAGAAWLFERPALDILVFGGASFFQVMQDLVGDVTFDEQYPYDMATFADAETERVEGSATGFNLGADLTWKLSPRWGVGGLVRYSRAELPLDIDGVKAGTLTAGGVAVAGGLRVRF